MARGSVGGVAGCIIFLGGVSLGCGGGAGDGADPATSHAPEASSEDGSEGGENAPGADLDDRFALAGSTPACGEGFSACGGLLSSEWVVEDTCGAQVANHDDAESWTRERLGLDAAACPSTVTRLDSIWSGRLSFLQGEALDERTRTDTLELDLTRGCLSASYGSNADGDVAGVCAALSDGSLECAAQGDVCHCSARREEQSGATGVYGVLGLSVAVGRSPTTRYEYCVAGEELHWMESNQRVVLRHVPGTVEPGSEDPVETPR